MNKLNEAAEKAVQAFNEYNAALQECKEQENKHLKGYMFDSLMYRYMQARDAQTELQVMLARKEGKCIDIGAYQSRANRDKMRFMEILDEAIGEHD